MKKRGQAWAFDLMIATIIFISGIFAFYLYSLNYQTEAQETLDSLFYEGNSVAEDLLSEGFPNNWNEGNVQRIGLTSFGKINETKLEKFYNLSLNSSQITSILKLNNYYYVNLSDTLLINEQIIDGIGNIPNNPENIIKISRLTIYKDKPSTLNIFIWN